MTFFANSGIRWPKLEQETRQAGADVLEAASQLWRLFARLERRQQERVDRELFAEGAERLDNASKVYLSIAEQLDGEYVDVLSPSEFEVAAVEGGSSFYDDEWARYRSSRRSSIPIAELYWELSNRTGMLASALRTFEPNREDRDLAPQVFSMMNQWEKIATLARVIAVFNRRSVVRHPESLL